MQELEKILEEIDLLEDEYENHFSVKNGITLYVSGALDACKAIKEIIRKHMNSEENKDEN